uniref:Uncharacterized protein n=1 Tax=Serinus canaria TaxID=9135 RepID=A0A8C9KRE8_SERCA
EAASPVPRAEKPIGPPWKEGTFPLPPIPPPPLQHRAAPGKGCTISALSTSGSPLLVLIMFQEFCRQGCFLSCRQDTVSKFCHVEMGIVPSFAPCLFMRSKK